MIAWSEGLRSPVRERGRLDPFGEPQRRAGMALPPVVVRRVVAPAMRVGVMAVGKPGEDMRSLRAAGQLLHKRGEHRIGRRKYGISWHAYTS